MQAVQLLDANEALFFRRALEQIKNKTFEKIYPALDWREVFPINTDTNPGATEIVYFVYDQVGSAKIVSAGATDLPSVDVKAKEVRSPIRMTGTSFKYNIKEIRSAALAGGTPLNQQRANAGRKATEQEHQTIAYYGEAEHGLIGLFTHPNIPKTAVADPGSGTEWVNKTADEILADVNGAFTALNEDSNGVHEGNFLGLPIKQWNMIFTTPRNTQSDTTIAQYLIQNSPYLSGPDAIRKMRELKGTGAGATDQMLVMQRDPDVLEYELVEELLWLPEQAKGLGYDVPGISQSGGLNVYYPLAIHLWYGI